MSADRAIRVTYGSREKRGECDKLEVDCEEGERIKTINGEGGGASHSSVRLSLFIRLYQLTGALLRGGDLLILATYDLDNPQPSHHSQDITTGKTIRLIRKQVLKTIIIRNLYKVFFKYLSVFRRSHLNSTLVKGKSRNPSRLQLT